MSSSSISVFSDVKSMKQISQQKIIFTVTRDLTPVKSNLGHLACFYVDDNYNGHLLVWEKWEAGNRFFSMQTLFRALEA